MQIFVFTYPAITYNPGPGGLYRKKHEKKHEILAFKSLLQEI